MKTDEQRELTREQEAIEAATVYVDAWVKMQNLFPNHATHAMRSDFINGFLAGAASEAKRVENVFPPRPITAKIHELISERGQLRDANQKLVEALERIVYDGTPRMMSREEFENLPPPMHPVDIARQALADFKGGGS
jgi:hypothetical protein